MNKSKKTPVIIGSIFVTIILIVIISIVGIKLNNTKKSPIEELSNVDLNIEELGSDGLGNSITNVQADGYVAYDKDFIYYNHPNIDKGKGVYKKNIETGEITELLNETGMHINLYEDKLYYLSGDNNLNGYNAIIIKSINKDGSNLEEVVSRDEKVTINGMQIIDDKLYYTVVNSEDKTKVDIMKIDLKTNEKSYIQTVKCNTMLVIKNHDNTIDIYLKNLNREENFRKTYVYSSVIKDVEGNNAELKEVQPDIDRIASMGEIDDKSIYYDVDSGYDSLSKQYSGRIISKNKNGEYTELSTYRGDFKDNNIMNFIIQGDKLYGINYNKEFGEIEAAKLGMNKIKNIDIRKYKGQVDVFGDKIFEVNGKLAYYNSSDELIIDEDIIIKKNKRNYKDKEIEKPKDKETEKQDGENILESMSSDEIYKLNSELTKLSDSGFDKLDSDNIDMNKIARVAFLYIRNSSEKRQLIKTETIRDKSYYTLEKDDLEQMVKELFNINIDISKLGEDENEEIYSEGTDKRRNIAFIDGKYAVPEANGKMFVKFDMIDKVTKIDKKTYRIEYKMYSITDHNYYEERDRIIKEKDFKGCEVTGKGIIEVKEQAVNGEKTYYIIKKESQLN